MLCRNFSPFSFFLGNKKSQSQQAAGYSISWNSCMLTWINLREKYPLDSFYQKINSKMTNGGKEILVYKPFFNADYVGLPEK